MDIPSASPSPSTPLSKTEWTLMNICWRLGTATARQVYEESLESQQRGYQTVKTLLDRMEGKGFLTRDKLGPLVLFTPAVEKRSALSSAIGDFVDTVLGRSLAPLCLHLAEQEGLEEAERRALEKLIDRLSEGDSETNVTGTRRGVQVSVPGAEVPAASANGEDKKMSMQSKAAAKKKRAKAKGGSKASGTRSKAKPRTRLGTKAKSKPGTTP